MDYMQGNEDKKEEIANWKIGISTMDDCIMDSLQSTSTGRR